MWHEKLSVTAAGGTNDKTVYKHSVVKQSDGYMYSDLNIYDTMVLRCSGNVVLLLWREFTSTTSLVLYLCGISNLAQYLLTNPISYLSRDVMNFIDNIDSQSLMIYPIQSDCISFVCVDRLSIWSIYYEPVVNICYIIAKVHMAG